MKTALIVALGACLLSACGGSGENAAPEESSPGSERKSPLPGAEQSPLPKSEVGRISVIGADPVIIVHDRLVAPGMTLEGRLEYVEETKALVVEGTRAEEEYTACAIWPKGVEPVVSGDRRGVEVSGFGAVLEGDTIIASGSFWKPEDERAKEIRDVYSCRADDGFIVFNADSFES
ncbi:hypothetical protein [Streptomyces sp. FZ201]|uniref:hypothetical protein n=1 Tax=Streptomyces sp. FZ201 TaxID=3057122 RepID=UPI0021BF05B9|nr:hypothetical protein [Streptomyces sp. FZ201]